MRNKIILLALAFSVRAFAADLYISPWVYSTNPPTQEQIDLALVRDNSAFSSGLAVGNARTITNGIHFQVIPVDYNYTITDAETNTFWTTNIVFNVDTSAGDVNLQFPQTFVNTFTVYNSGTNDINCLAFPGNTFMVAPTNGSIAYRTGLTNRYALKSQQFFMLTESNYVVSSDFRPLPNIIDDVVNNITGVSGTNGLNGADGAQGPPGINAAVGLVTNQFTTNLNVTIAQFQASATAHTTNQFTTTNSVAFMIANSNLATRAEVVASTNTLDAAKITVGILSPDRLGSGTSLQVLRRNVANTANEYATVAGIGDALVANSLAQFSVTPTTSAELRLITSDESGTGAAMFAGGNMGAGTATTATVNDNSTKIATTAYVDSKLKTVATTIFVTNATTTAAKITALDTTTGTGTFVFQYFVRYGSTATTTGVKFSVNHSGTLTSFVANMRYGSTGGAAATAAATQVGNTATGNIHESFTRRAIATSANMGPTVSVDAANSDCLMIIEGLLVCTVDGNIQLYHASETAVATYVAPDSVLILTKIK